MRRFINLGTFNLSGVESLSKFNLSKLPEMKNYHIGQLIFRIDLRGTATGSISKSDFLRKLIKKFNLYQNNKLIADNLTGQTLHFIFSRIGYQFFGDMIPKISGAGEYNISYYFSFSYKNSLLLSPYDFCPAISDIKSLDFEILLGDIPELGTHTRNIKVIAEIFERENEYYVPEIKLRQITISKEISDIINIPNRCLFWLFELPQDGNLDDVVILRNKTGVIIENQKLRDVGSMFLPPVIYDNIQINDYSFIPFTIPEDGYLSVKKPALYENDQLFYDDLDVSNSPFEFFTYEILPNEFIGGTQEFESRYSPIKK